MANHPSANSDPHHAAAGVDVHVDVDLKNRAPPPLLRMRWLFYVGVICCDE
jgi:hypothetical protein